jgi:hypothetical protein
MQYMCLIYTDEASWQTRSEEEQNKIGADYFAFTKSIQDSGNHVAGDALQPTSTATTVRVRDGEMLVTDGPFAETKEQLAGFYLIEATDLNDAIQVASKIPPAREGSIEVRPVRELNV